MATKIITRGILSEVPVVSSGADVNKGSSLTAAEFDQNLVNLRAAVDNVSGVTQFTAQANTIVTGGGTITFNASGYLLWSARFIVIDSGRGAADASVNGCFDISCPTSGTITGVGGAANKTATASGIPLLAWESLYYILPIGSSNPSIPANFRVSSYTVDQVIPATWLKIATYNGDSSVLSLATGYNLKPGYTINSALPPLQDSAYNSFGAGTMPVRHAAGYLFSNYFNMTANVDPAVPTHIAMQTSGDNYLRWQTWSQFKTNLFSTSILVGASSSLALTITGDNIVATNNGVYSNLYLNYNSTADTILGFGTGNVLVGTATDNGAKLQVTGAITSTMPVATAEFSSLKLICDNSGYPYGNLIEGGIEQGQGSLLKVSTIDNGAPVERMRLRYNGNLLIGTTTDNGSKLQVAGGISATTGLTVGATTTATQSVFSDYYGGARGAIVVKNTGDAAGSRGSGISFQSGAAIEKCRIVSYSKDGTQDGYDLEFCTTATGGALTRRAFITETGLSVYGGISTSTTITLTGSSITTGFANDASGLYGNVPTGKTARFLVNSTDVAVISSTGLAITGAVTATGNITAYYSDDRLKTKIGNIQDALNKVLSINGFTYKANSLANSFGYKEGHQQVGVSAQEIQKIQPEAVSLAPFDTITKNGKQISKSGDNYLTVDYQRLVPLLIEAIKEQQKQIEELKEIIKK